ncbi:MAG TPA: histidinol-phosphate transaminase [Candidatus Thermoplasmatota archaeon]|nr:histidinol-phosphate transaminase [Candidatus Thermoplasmatota archaeon]
MTATRTRAAQHRMGLLRLDQNTNVLGPNPVLARLELGGVDLSLYPEPHSETLCEALTAHHALRPGSVVVTRGSDEALDLLARAVAGPRGHVSFPTPGFERYGSLASQHHLVATPVPLRGLRDLDVDGLCEAGRDLIIVANPNNPTGHRVAGGELERLLSSTKAVVAVDEAYIEYAGARHSLLPRLESHPNLVVLRTFSKAYALAGLRIGWLAAAPALAKRLREAKAPFNVDTIAQSAARLALGEQAWVDGCVDTVRHERVRLAEALGRRDCQVRPSEANFLLVRVPADPGLLAAAMRERGVAVKPYAEGPVAGHLRITVGGPAHTDATLTAFDAALESLERSA